MRVHLAQARRQIEQRLEELTQSYAEAADSDTRAKIDREMKELIMRLRMMAAH